MMVDGGHHENCRLGPDQYKAAQSQWLFQIHQPSMTQIMSIMAERDAAIQERNLAISEKKLVISEQDLAYLHRDNAVKERNNAIMERDSALAILHYREWPVNSNLRMLQLQTQCPTGCQLSCELKNMHHHQQNLHDKNQQFLNEVPYNSRDLHIIEAIPLNSYVASRAAKSNGNKRKKETKSVETDRKAPKNPKKVKRESDTSSKLLIGNVHEWKDEYASGSSNDDLSKQIAVTNSKRKCQDLGLNLVIYDSTIMPPPVCSCTGVPRRCYRWGNGGWQSSCCTASILQYPLPPLPNKRHSRVGGRKMSGGAFNKLLTKLAAEGYDLSNPVDLKENWAKHGTNRYITIK